MIMGGMKREELIDIISKNTFSKLEALTKLNYYKKCQECVNKNGE